MKQKTKIILSLLTLAAVFSPSTYATTLDFDELLVGGGDFIGNSYTSKGYDLSSTSSLIGYKNHAYNPPGSGVIVWNQGSVSLTKSDASNFNLLSIDFNDLRNQISSGLPTAQIDISAYDHLNNVLFSSSILLDKNKGFETFNFNWSNVNKVTWFTPVFNSLSEVNDYSVFDNIVATNASAVSAVPEPETLFMFATGLISLLGYSRKKNKK